MVHALDVTRLATRAGTLLLQGGDLIIMLYGGAAFFFKRALTDIELALAMTLHACRDALLSRASASPFIYKHFLSCRAYWPLLLSRRHALRAGVARITIQPEADKHAEARRARSGRLFTSVREHNARYAIF